MKWLAALPLIALAGGFEAGAKALASEWPQTRPSLDLGGVLQQSAGKGSARNHTWMCAGMRFRLEIERR